MPGREDGLHRAAFITRSGVSESRLGQPDVGCWGSGRTSPPRAFERRRGRPLALGSSRHVKHKGSIEPAVSPLFTGSLQKPLVPPPVAFSARLAHVSATPGATLG